MPLDPLVSSQVVLLSYALIKGILTLRLKGDVNEALLEIGKELTDLIKEPVYVLGSSSEHSREVLSLSRGILEDIRKYFDNNPDALSTSERDAILWSLQRAMREILQAPSLVAQSNLSAAILERYMKDNPPYEVSVFTIHQRAAYDRLVELASGHIIRNSSRIPGLVEEAVKELLRRTAVSHDADEFFEGNYRRSVVGYYNFIELFGVPVSAEIGTYDLSTAFVTLSAQYSASSRSGGAITQALPVDSAISQSDRILIRGDAGSGKTTLLHWLAVRSASRTLARPLGELNDSIPFVISLREFSTDPLPSPEHFPDQVARNFRAEMPPSWVHNHLRVGSALLLVDGVDEIPSSRRKDVRQWLQTLIRDFPRLRIIITSRPHAVDESWLGRLGFVELKLEEMRPTDVSTFIERWHTAAKLSLVHSETPETMDLLSRNLHSIIAESEAIARLATNPLLCGMICALHRQTRKELPDNRVRLYTACCEMLLLSRDKQKDLNLSDYIDLRLDEQLNLISDLAYWMLDNREARIAVEDCDQFLGRKLSSYTAIKDAAQGAQVRIRFVHRSGLLREAASEHVEFVHRTFQEFLAARFAERELNIGVLKKHSLDDQWQEVIILAAALLRRKETENLITHLINAGREGEANRYQLHLLAVACRESALRTGVMLSDKLEGELNGIIAELVPPKSFSDAASMAQAGEIAVPHLARGHRMPPDPEVVAAACVRALAEIRGRGALNALTTYIEDPRDTVRAELLRAWSHFDIDEYAKRVLVPGEHRRLFINDPKQLKALLTFTELNELTVQMDLRVDDLRYIEDLPYLNAVTLAQADDRQMQAIAKIRGLRRLTLRGSISELRALQPLENLEVLDIASTEVKEVAPLLFFPALRGLNLRSTRVNDLRAIGLKSRLVELDLSYTDISDVSPIKGLEALEILEMEGIVATEFGSLKDLHRLRVLNIAHTRGRRSDWLEAMTHLQVLKVTGSSLGDLSGVARLEALQELEMADTREVREGFDALARLRRLRRLILDRTQLESLSVIRELTELAELSLSYSRVSDIPDLKGLPRLSELRLAWCRRVRDFSALLECRALTHVDLTGTEQYTVARELRRRGVSVDI